MGRLEEANDQLEQLMQQLDSHPMDPEVRVFKRFTSYPQAASVDVSDSDAQSLDVCRYIHVYVSLHINYFQYLSI